MDTIKLVYIYFYVSLDTRSDKLALVINNFRRNFSHCFWTIILYQVFLAVQLQLLTPCSRACQLQLLKPTHP